ncbi:uncharacterized protein A1O9_04749 [Exophiala aquamarina CBS 119918]|uniref:Uncharacterized protein n=1 Tax=Exophiala aquamarina CBS 119918 TaxID=1182545 RepID=A0A072PJ44_9EURO|nr:uncharacterized protein A1O9_04749 [Exophiala aquamarina CBS 119918]KEF59901.1 hypothetical protein A1O9_04749 [Exophiala aquamarina CBS 119918]
MAPNSKRRVPTRNKAAKLCQHTDLTCTPSPHALNSGYHHYTQTQIHNAATGNKKLRVSDGVQAFLEAFPSPLGLPRDDVTLDPKYPAQSKNAWMSLPERNAVTMRRSVIYVAAPPLIDDSIRMMREWSRPVVQGKALPKSQSQDSFDVNAVVDYLKAFYHGLEVRLLHAALSFLAWNDEPTPKPGKSVRSTSHRNGKVECVGLSTGKELIRIRVREAPIQNVSSSANHFPYRYQLDLNDLTDAALSLLPADAYSLLLTAEQDLYESVEDDFCCGRAWGASRVAIVSSARYIPSLDPLHGVDTEHVWPASHCLDFVESMSLDQSDGSVPGARGEGRTMKRCKTLPITDESVTTPTPLKRAVTAHQSTRRPTAADLQSMLLLRICRTASHELGHCFGLDHCMYRACVMQATSSVAEDMRQPPYLCPVCDAKLAWAILNKASQTQSGTKPMAKGRAKRKLDDIEIEGEEGRKWRKERLVATKEFCQGQGSGFAGLVAFSTGVLEFLERLDKANMDASRRYHIGFSDGSKRDESLSFD